MQNKLKRKDLIKRMEEKRNSRLLVYTCYNEILELNIPYISDACLTKIESKKFNLNRAIVESSDLTYIYRTAKKIKRISTSSLVGNMPAQVDYQEIRLFEGWVRDDLT